jgi:hypothetical protein
MRLRRSNQKVDPSEIAMPVIEHEIDVLDLRNARDLTFTLSAPAIFGSALGRRAGSIAR